MHVITCVALGAFTSVEVETRSLLALSSSRSVVATSTVPTVVMATLPFQLSAAWLLVASTHCRRWPLATTAGVGGRFCCFSAAS